jgi:acetoin utilization deacetylase AcuC-like enzyme
MMTARLTATAASLCEGRLVLCHEGGYSSTYVPYCGLAVIESLAGVRTDVVDPWLTDARRVRELPLREHERDAIDQAVAQHRLT